MSLSITCMYFLTSFTIIYSLIVVEDPVLIKRSATTAGVIKRGSIKLEPEAVEWLQSAVCLSLVHSLSIENFFVLMKIGVFVL